MSRLRGRIKNGSGGKMALEYCQVLLNDPCVYCGEFGCDTLDHITPVIHRDRMPEGMSVHNVLNYAPCHERCNCRKGKRGVLWHLMNQPQVIMNYLNGL